MSASSSLLLFLVIAKLSASQSILKISVDSDTVEIGGSVQVQVQYTDNINAYTVWPFVNNTQWGSDQPLTFPESTTTIILPFAHVGAANISVAILKEPYFDGVPWTVGQPLPSSDQIIAISNALTVNVKDSAKYYRSSGQSANDSMVIMYWEPWFTADNRDWTRNEAIPLVGRYDSFNQDVMKQHVLWFSAAGVDAIGIDWTNNLWNCASWDQRGVYAQNLINATTATLQYYHYLQTELNLKVPEFVLLLGLDNGASASYHALNGEIQWVTDNYWLNPNITDLFIMYEGKPLLTIFDGGDIHGQNGSLNASVDVYTYRWMGSQFQATQLQNKGFYSWMDGTLQPLPTYVNGSNNSEVEALTITTAFFPASGGWFSPQAYATNNGATLLAEGISALKYQPHFLFICQWNEFAGQANGAANYVDIYNSTLGNDIEPTSLTQCGYDRPNNAYCGGWGFRQLNILHAITYLLNAGSSAVDSLFVVISNPVPWRAHSKSMNGLTMSVQWVQLGTCEQSVMMVILDTVNIANVSRNALSYSLNLANVAIGTHIIQLMAQDCVSAIDLSYDHLSPVLPENDMVATSDAVQFVIDS